MTGGGVGEGGRKGETGGHQESQVIRTESVLKIHLRAVLPPLPQEVQSYFQK